MLVGEEAIGHEVLANPNCGVLPIRKALQAAKAVACLCMYGVRSTRFQATPRRNTSGPSPKAPSHLFAGSRAPGIDREG